MQKIYALQSFQGDFIVGRIRDGSQVFMGMYYPNLTAVFFDSEGTYLKTQIRELPKRTKGSLNHTLGNGRWDTLNEGWEALENWANEVGLVQGKIGVRKFSLPEHNLAIEDLPEIYRELRASGRHVVDDLEEQIQCWQQENDYVLVWGREYDMDQEGEVIST